MSMEYSGKVIEVGEIISGTSSKTGKDWHIQDVVIQDASSQREKYIAFEVFGKERIESFDMKVGDNVSVTLDLESRKWKDKWFTSARCTKCEKEQLEEIPEEEEVPAVKAEPAPKEKKNEVQNDLPF